MRYKWNEAGLPKLTNTVGRYRSKLNSVLGRRMGWFVAIDGSGTSDEGEGEIST